MKKNKSMLSKSESDQKRQVELEMIRLIERGIEDFQFGRVLTQREVRSRLEEKFSKSPGRSKK